MLLVECKTTFNYIWKHPVVLVLETSSRLKVCWYCPTSPINRCSFFFLYSMAEECIFAPFTKAPFIHFHFIDVWHMIIIKSRVRIKNFAKSWKTKHTRPLFFLTSSSSPWPHSISKHTNREIYYPLHLFSNSKP